MEATIVFAVVALVLAGLSMVALCRPEKPAGPTPAEVAAQHAAEVHAAYLMGKHTAIAHRAALDAEMYAMGQRS